MSQAFLQVQGLGKRYPGRNGQPQPPVFENIDFTIEQGPVSYTHLTLPTTPYV